MLDLRHKHHERTGTKRKSVVLFSAAAPTASSQNNNTAENGSSRQEDTPTTNLRRRTDLDMPWSEIQEWALRDRLERFTITVPIVDATTTTTTTTLQSYTLWRALVQDSTELAGYPLSFLVQRAVDLRADKDDETQTQQQSPQSSSCFSYEILPFLDDYCFEATGGLSGKSFGIVGVADGTRIQTQPVTQVETTLPQNYVRTADGQVVYELGRPLEMSTATAGNDMASRDAATVATSTSSLLPAVRIDNNDEDNNNKNELVLDSDLINIAGLTAVVIAGATAMASLSHHLTVNVFWV